MAAWDRLEEETDLAYQAFIIYLNITPPRTAKKAVELGQGAFSMRSVVIWSPTHRWIERARAYDMQITEAAMEAKSANFADFQDTVLQDELEDYHKMRDVWIKLFETTSSDETVDIEKKLRYIQELARTRQLIDAMGRKLAQMPNTYAGKAPEKSVTPAEQIMITKDGVVMTNDE